MCIQTLRNAFRRGLLTYYASITYSLNFYFLVRPIKMLMYHIQSYSYPKMSYISFSKHLGSHNLLCLNKNSSCLKYLSKIECSHCPYTWPKSSSSIYNSFTTYLQDNESAMMFSLLYLYLMTYENILMNSIHLACCLLNLPWLFKCSRDWWSLCITNFLGQR
jgi:hypothetical protein